MAVRTTKALIESIIELDAQIVPDDAAMLPFIMTANVLVTEACVTKGPSVAYDDERLELIERWLAAHLYTVRDPRLTQEGAGAVSAGFQMATGIGFDSSHYGQTAMRMDTNGGLARINEETKKGKPPALGARWLGTASTTSEGA